MNVLLKCILVCFTVLAFVFQLQSGVVKRTWEEIINIKRKFKVVLSYLIILMLTDLSSVNLVVVGTTQGLWFIVPEYLNEGERVHVQCSILVITEYFLHTLKCVWRGFLLCSAARKCWLRHVFRCSCFLCFLSNCLLIKTYNESILCWSIIMSTICACYFNGFDKVAATLSKRRRSNLIFPPCPRLYKATTNNGQFLYNLIPGNTRAISWYDRYNFQNDLITIQSN